MAVPKAKTKMTRSNWSRSKRPNTKTKDLALSQNVTVMSRYGSKSIAKYASTYMSRDNAAMPPIDDVGVKPHDIDDITDDALVAENDISRDSMGIHRERRLFDASSNGLTYDEMLKKIKIFEKAQASGHTSIIQVISFSQKYLCDQNVLSKDFSDVKGQLARSLDDSKLRIAIRSSVAKMAEQSGFSNLEYVAAIHGNTNHPHVHVAMIETDDNATGRLAAREKTDQLADDAENNYKSIGKSPAALAYDRKHHLTSTVERGMMRQSEIDFFRQEIDNSLTNMSDLVTVRDLEYQRTYASVVNLDVLRHAHHDKAFMNDFAQVVALLKKPIKQDTVVNLALDRRVERMSRTLLSGSDFGQTKYMAAQYQLAVKLAKEQALAKAVMIHSAETPSQETVDDYATMNLDVSKYNGVVLTPSEFSDQNQDLNPQIYLDYVTRYKSFIETPSMSNLEGLVLRLPKELDTTENVKDIVSRQDQMLVDMTKSSVYQMLSHVKKDDVVGADIRQSLAKSLKNIRGNYLAGVSESDEKSDEIKSFQKRLRSVGVRNSSPDDTLAEIVTTAEHGRVIDRAPDEIKSARELLKSTYKENINDLDAMMTVSAGRHLSKDDRQDLLEKSRNLRELTLGTGDLSNAGSMLHAALSAEIYNTGSLERVHKLKLGEREELFLAYKEATLNKVAAITVAIDDLNKGISFSEPVRQQSMRSDLTDTLKDMSDGYASKLEFVDKIEEIAKLPDADEKEAIAQLMLSQAIWREGMDAGLASAEIEDRIKSQSDLSTQDKLAITMSMSLNELSNDIEEQTYKAVKIAQEMSSENNDNDFDASKLLNDHLRQNRLKSVDNTYTSEDVSLIDSDIVYNPANYEFVVDNQNIVKRDVFAKSLSENEVMQLNVVVKHFDDAVKNQNTDIVLANLEKERRESQKLSMQDVVILDNEIKMSYDRLVEKDLYERQQRLANVHDLTLSNDVKSLESYEMSTKQHQVVVETHKPEHQDEAVIQHTTANTIEKDRNALAKNKDKDKGLSR